MSYDIWNVGEATCIIAPDHASVPLDFDGVRVKYEKSEMSMLLLGYAISIHFTDLDYLILIVCSIAAALLFTITFACLMSIIFKKALDATAFQLVFFIIFDVLNIFTFGLTNPCDANSLATVTVRYISGIPIAHKSLESIKLDFETFKWVYTITPSIVYSIIIIIIILVILCGKRVGGIYVTKHKD